MPGCLASALSRIDSFGCRRIVSRFEPGRKAIGPNAECGTGPEVDDNFSNAAREPLAGAQKKRHTRPTPVFHLDFQRDEMSRSCCSGLTPGSA